MIFLSVGQSFALTLPFLDKADATGLEIPSYLIEISSENLQTKMSAQFVRNWRVRILSKP